MFFRGFPTHLQWITAFNKKFKIEQKNLPKKGSEKDRKRIKKWSPIWSKKGALKIGKRELFCDFSKYQMVLNKYGITVLKEGSFRQLIKDWYYFSENDFRCKFLFLGLKSSSLGMFQLYNIWKCLIRENSTFWGYLGHRGPRCIRKN